MHYPVPVVLADSQYMSETTHFVHLLVTDIANLLMYVMELLSVIIIVMTTVIAFYKLFKHKPYARVYLLHGQSVGLSFKLGAEILRTITAQSIMDIWQILLLILIKAAMMLLIEWELKGAEDPYEEKGFSTTRKDKEEIRHSIFYHKAHPEKHQEDLAELTEMRNELNDIIEKAQSKEPPQTGTPIL